MKKKIVIGLVALVVLFYIFTLVKREKEPKIAIIRINDTIVDYMETVQSMAMVEKDQSIKALVVVVDSPGGAVGASQEIYRSIERLREKKPVVVSMGNVAASGGYYISAPANVIYANPGTITGSIGVIIQQIDLSDIMNKIGIKVNTVKSGENKDILYPNKSLTPQQREILQETVMDVYDQFLDAIVKYRKIDKEKLKKYADGRVFSGRQAKEIGLVDKLGNLQDAVREAKNLAKLPEDASVIEIAPSKDFLQELLKSKFKFGMDSYSVKSGVYYLMRF